MLFEVIFKEAARKLFPKINFIFESEMPLFEKIEHFCEEYIMVMMEKAMFQMNLGLDELQFRSVMEQRKKEIPKFIIDSIKK